MASNDFISSGGSPVKLCLFATLASVACVGPQWPGRPPQPLDRERVACKPEAPDSGPRKVVALTQAPGYVLSLPASFTPSAPDTFLSGAGQLADAFVVSVMNHGDLAPDTATVVAYVDGVPVSPPADPPSWCQMTVAGRSTYIGLNEREGYAGYTFTVSAMMLLPSGRVMLLRGTTRNRAMQSRLLSAIHSLARRPAT